MDNRTLIDQLKVRKTALENRINSFCSECPLKQFAKNEIKLED